jgi:hypothetical protein
MIFPALFTQQFALSQVKTLMDPIKFATHGHEFALKQSLNPKSTLNHHPTARTHRFRSLAGIPP